MFVNASPPVIGPEELPGGHAYVVPMDEIVKKRLQRGLCGGMLSSETVYAPRCVDQRMCSNLIEAFCQAVAGAKGGGADRTLIDEAPLGRVGKGVTPQTGS